jgi:acyl carrier protein
VSRSASPEETATAKLSPERIDAGRVPQRHAGPAERFEVARKLAERATIECARARSRMSVYEAIQADIREFLASNYELELDSIPPHATLEDAGFDSLGLLGIATLLENKYGLNFDGASMVRVETFTDLIELVKAKVAESA